jgi:hypothetical protein
MNSQALILTPICRGWAIDLTGGARIAEFHGPGAGLRARRRLAQMSHGALLPPLSDWPAMC